VREVHLDQGKGAFMARIMAIACTTVMALVIMGSFNLVAPRDGLIMLGGKAYAADMPTKAPVAAAPIGKGKAPLGVGKGKAPIATRG
jgi:hypothetical protein